MPVGQLAVTAALNFIHVIFGSYHMDRMMVGGPRMENDRRAHITIKQDGNVDVSCSSSATSAVGFHEGWEALLERETAPLLIITGPTEKLSGLAAYVNRQGK